MNDGPRWRVIASSYPIDTRFLRLRKDTIELPDGTRVEEYFVRESRGFVIIFALTQDERVLLVRQYKHGAARTLLELPAGAIDPGEEPAQCARRELLEETGYAASSMEFVRAFVTDPTNSDTLAHLFVARGAHRVAEQNLDPTESIEVSLASLAELHALTRDGAIESLPHVAAVYLMLERLGFPQSKN